MNKAFLIGRLVRDPDTRETESGLWVSRFTLAVKRKYKREGDPAADYIECVAFGKIAELFINEYVTKGTKLVVTGRIKTDSYTNSDGHKVYTTEVIVDEAELAESLDPKD